jgi:hypothetical protein
MLLYTAVQATSASLGLGLHTKSWCELLSCVCHISEANPQGLPHSSPACYNAASFKHACLLSLRTADFNGAHCDIAALL